MSQTTTQAPAQGIMTVEVGAITGDVVITTDESTDGVAVSVAYDGADETYVVEGSPVRAGTAHEEIVARLTADTGAPTSLT